MSSASRTRIAIRVLLAMAIGFAMVEFVGGLLFLVGFSQFFDPAKTDLGLAAALTLGGVGLMLKAHHPGVYVPVVTVVATGFAYVTTMWWSPRDLVRACLATAVTSALVFTAVAIPWHLADNRREEARMARARAEGQKSTEGHKLRGRIWADLFRPDSLRVVEEATSLVLVPFLSGGIAGRYRIDTRVIARMWGDELAHHSWEVDLPSDSLLVDDSFPFSQLDSSFYVSLGRPGAPVNFGELDYRVEYEIRAVKTASPEAESLMGLQEIDSERRIDLIHTRHDVRIARPPAGR